MTSLPSPFLAPAIRTREQLEAVVENIVQMRLELRAILRAQESEITAVREKYGASLAELDSFLQKETAWVEAWAQANPTAFADRRSVPCTHATLGYRDTEPRVERASRKWTWTAAALKLAETSWGRRYLRIPSPEVDKEAILTDLANLSADTLRESGLKIVQGERFFIEPHPPSQETNPASESTWQKAA